MSKKKKLYTPQILIYCEGSTDKYFINAIKTAYGNDRRFVIQSGSGGSCQEVLTKCINVAGDYEKYCVVDAVPKISQKLRKVAEDNQITLVEISPYLECVELNYLKNTEDHLKGEDRNSAKKKMRTYIKENGDDLEALLNSAVTVKLLKTKKHLLGNFSILVDLFEKCKNSNKKSGY